MNSERLPILITAIGGGGHGEQILKALRLAENGRYFIVGADAQRNSYQATFVDEFLTLPFASDPAYMSKLLQICEKYRIKALFHGCEPELKLFSKNRAEIEGREIFLPINSEEVIDLCMDKQATNQRLTKMGFLAPKYCVVRNREEIGQIDWFPVVVKPSVGGGGSANVYIAQDQTELLGLANYLGLDTIAGSFVIQEYVGTPGDEYTVGVLHDMDGNYINSIAVHRQLSGQLNVRQSVTNCTGRAELGNRLVISSGVSHGYVGRFEEITKQCAEIAAAIGVRGAVNIQCRFVNGKVRVFEINPRFSGTTSLRAMMGYNEPDVLIRRHVLGEKIDVDFSYEEGQVLRGLVEYRTR